MSVLSQSEIEAMVNASRPAEERKADEKARSIHSCNFRSAGRLSNENARSLTAIHEAFARQLSTTLDAYLGTGLEVKLQGIDQLPTKEHIANIPAMSYIVPFSLRTAASTSTMIVVCDIDVVFPIIELLLGGSGGSPNGVRELSEIEEEIMQDVTSLIARQAELAWHFPNLSLEPSRRIKPSQLNQFCSPNEKVTLLNFTVEIAGATGSFQLVFPALFTNVLINQIKQDQPQGKGRLRYFPMASIRERILDCDVVVAAGLLSLKVAVRDLIALQPGCVLKLRAPVRTPGMLTVEGREIFEAVPVRNGSQKAAQLGRRAQGTSGGGE